MSKPMSSNSAPGYANNPNHRIETRPAGVRVRVTFDGEVIADSMNALRLEEGTYPPVYYVPRSDVKMERLVRTQHSSYCPYKGHASYYSLSGSRISENAVWSYEAPYDEMRAIKDLVAFYPNRVDAIQAG
jgi:uncharacterized protein (DUF427 family)